MIGFYGTFMSQKEMLEGSFAKRYQLIYLQAGIIVYIDVLKMLGYIFVGLAQKQKASVENENF